MERIEWIYEEHRIYGTGEDGEILAEIDFPEAAFGVVDLNHTYVSEKLRGQGIAGWLMEEAVKRIRQKGWQARTSCSYAKRWMETHGENR